jgi:hypothetical protein
MKIENWSFEQFSNWLTLKSRVLREEGYTVEIQHNNEVRPSIRLRAERVNRVGELTVWNDGAVSEAVIDLKAGDFVHMRDGNRLDSDWENQLRVFFLQTAGG